MMFDQQLGGHMSADNITDPRDALRARPAGTLETREHKVARLRTELGALNSQASLVMSLTWHAERLTKVAEIERQLREMGEKV
jgi:hypothetical protein